MGISFKEFAHPFPDAGGDASELQFALTDLTVQDSSIVLPKAGVTAFVGGNNVGKSTLLRHLSEWLRSDSSAPPPQPELIKSATVERRGNNNDLLAWLYAHRPVGKQGPYVGVLSAEYGVLNADMLTGTWGSQSSISRLSFIGSIMASYAGTEERLTMSQPAARRADFTDPASHPLHRLEDEPELLEELASIAREAFRQDLVLDPLSGNLMLRVGTPSVTAPPVDKVSVDYRDALSNLRPLHEQGDGMRSFVGLLLPIVASTFPIVIVDEPEAFLHPPQARILGRELARLATARDIQVVLATHDKNILMGLLDSPDSSVSVVRLTRQDRRTTANQLVASELRDAWSNPALRYSNILDGLFHRAVVLAENERDCRFYAAAVDSANHVAQTPISPDDVLFIPTAGKTNIKPLIGTMRACGVPTIACADLDLLNDETNIRGVVEALGGDWTRLKNDYTIATNQFKNVKNPLKNGEVAAMIAAVLNESKDATYDTTMKKSISKILSVDSPWQQLKKYGMNAFSDQRARAEALMSELDAVGVVLVREGELEGFGRHVEATKGSGWVPAAIQQGAHTDRAAREHVLRILDSAVKQEASALEEQASS